MQAMEAARQAAAQAVANTTTALRMEMEQEPRAPRRSPDPRRKGPTQSPDRRRRDQSPARHRGRGGRRESPVIQTVYKDSGTGTPWPMLTKTNYQEWSLLMRLKMRAR